VEPGRLNAALGQSSKPERKLLYEPVKLRTELFGFDQFCGEFEQKVPLFGGIHMNLQSPAGIIIYL
jgi:hypothetical protein